MVEEAGGESTRMVEEASGGVYPNGRGKLSRLTQNLWK